MASGLDEAIETLNCCKPTPIASDWPFNGYQSVVVQPMDCSKFAPQLSLAHEPGTLPANGWGDMLINICGRHCVPSSKWVTNVSAITWRMSDICYSPQMFAFQNCEIAHRILPPTCGQTLHRLLHILPFTQSKTSSSPPLWNSPVIRAIQRAANLPLWLTRVS